MNTNLLAVCTCSFFMHDSSLYARRPVSVMINRIPKAPGSVLFTFGLLGLRYVMRPKTDLLSARGIPRSGMPLSVLVVWRTSAPETQGTPQRFDGIARNCAPRGTSFGHFLTVKQASRFGIRYWNIASAGTMSLFPRC